jgi:hypothetical protein
MIKFIALAASIITTSVGFAAEEVTNLNPPECLQPNINFWHSVYTEYTKHDLIVFNKETMEIYGVYPRPKGSKRAVRATKKQLIYKHAKVLPKTERKNVSVQSGARGLYERGLLNFGIHYPAIAEELEKHNMPPQIALLPFVESAYNSKATSPVGAVGMWQIMPKTGRLYGVKNKKNLRNHEVAMKTAIKILKANKEMLGDWILAINAYHSGPGRIMQASDIANSKDICEILNFMDANDVKIKGYKFYSRNYVAQLFAIEKAVFGDLEEEGVEDEDESDYVDAGL